MFSHKVSDEDKKQGSYLRRLGEVGPLLRCKVPSVHGKCCTCFENENCICGTESYNCSSDRSEKNPSFCAWHEENTALPEPFKCGCRVQLLLVTGLCGAYSRQRFYKYLASLYPNDMCVDDITGIYCCADTRSYGETPYKCGGLRVGRCCKKTHSGCVRGSDTDSDGHVVDDPFVSDPVVDAAITAAIDHLDKLGLFNE